VFAIGLLCRFLCPILDPLAFAPNTFYTYKFKLSKYGLFQNPGLHVWFKLKPWFEQNQCFCVQTNIFDTKSCFTQTCVIHKVLHKNHVFAGPVHGLFAAYRIALSMMPAEDAEGG
jgi:hypothetical protein